MKTKWTTGFLLGFFLAANSSGAERSSQTNPSIELATITIEIYDYAHMEPGRLLEAERIAGATLLKAGVKAEWLAESTEGAPFSTGECAVAANPTHLTLRVLPDSLSNSFRFVRSDALGFASLCGRFSSNAWVLSDRVMDFALVRSVLYERLLGAVIAHELSHLLLGENTHSGAGLMHASWSRGELTAVACGQLALSDTERKRIHAEVIARHDGASVAMAHVPSWDSRTRPN